MKRILRGIALLFITNFCMSMFIGILNNNIVSHFISGMIYVILTAVLLQLTIDHWWDTVIYYIRKHKKKKENKKQMKSKEIVLTVKFHSRKNPKTKYIQAFSSDIDLARCVVKAIDCAKQNDWIIYSMETV